jgi:hypothetical protein
MERSADQDLPLPTIIPWNANALSIVTAKATLATNGFEFAAVTFDSGIWPNASLSIEYSRRGRSEKYHYKAG